MLYLRALMLKKVFVNRAEPKLNWKDEQKLTNAFEITTFTTTYIARMEGKAAVKNVNKLGKPITRSVKFLEDFTIAFLNQMKTKGQKHWIRLCRHLIQLLRKVLTKLEEDYINMDYCEGNCSLDRKTNKSDRLVIIGLIKFAIHGLGPITGNGEDVSATYDNFFKLNKGAIEASVDFDG